MNNIRQKAFLIIALLAALVLAGCGQQTQQETAVEKPAVAEEPTPIIVVATPTPQPPPTPEPTPSLPAYAVNAVSLTGEPIIIEDMFGQDTLLWFWAPW